VAIAERLTRRLPTRSLVASGRHRGDCGAAGRAGCPLGS
jgi:hypothetical protein